MAEVLDAGLIARFVRAMLDAIRPLPDAAARALKRCPPGASSWWPCAGSKTPA
ncbi:hypothetical protein AFCDBAGC_2356 [Methylobacterium cerastii]|uniref:Uncharacterized protein n=1 Tax=Methylobacterium cerastii TaxID=932741 RepID=A0ABQ4QGW7_9HYPH|nr:MULTISPECIES: hypothetical protein [Methylobacterium]GJD44489.1 hypothetical protein AFCDBAGC_2356 [Methylobacterium cerastii]